MPFHVEIRRSFRRAWAFNLDEGRLRRAVVDPWRRGARVELGDREWEPRESTLRILEGPELSAPELAHGQGWHQAERSGRDVTRELVRSAAPAAVAVIGQSPAGERAVREIVGRLDAPVVDWAAVRARILAAARTPAPGTGLAGVAAVLVAERFDPPASWLFEAGLALGALGGRAVLVQLGDRAPPAPLRDLGAIRLNPEEPISFRPLAERLGLAGAGAGTLARNRPTTGPESIA
jgi:hypothetical protein